MIGSAHEAESLWSMAKHILTHNRMSMAPHKFECLIFLKVNKHLWHVNLVPEAMSMIGTSVDEDDDGDSDD